MSRNRTIISTVGLLLASVSTTAFAQASDDGALTDIVVTAERRTQNLQDVPISATVLSGEELTKRGVTNLNDIQQVAPSIAINTFNRSTFINIRGVGIAQSAPTSNPGVAYYIDGQLIPHEQFIGHSFYDIGSIEVLRGPQGTLTGQNSTGGAIYVRTPTPELESAFAIGDLTVGNYGRLRGVVAVNYGGKDAAVRIAYVHEERDSFTKNISTKAQSQPGNLNMDAVRANFHFVGDDNKLTVDLRGEYFNVQTDNNAVKRRNDTVSTDPYEIQEDARSYQNQVGYRIGAEARYELSDAVAVRGMVSWQDGYTHDQTDGDRTDTAPPRVPGNSSTNGNVGRVSRATTDFRTTLAELNLMSHGEGPLQWVVGGFLMDEDVPVTLLRDNNNVLDFVSSTSTTQANAKNTSYSLFGQANYYVTPEVELIAGGRYSWDKQVYTRYYVASVAPLATPSVGIASSEQLTGKLGINYHFGNDGLIYFTASKGYKAGGVNLTPGTPNFIPERNFVYELGFKTELLDRHLRVNGDIFRSNYKDIQLSSLIPGVAQPQTQNATSGEAWGGELEVTAKFGGFAANFGVGYLDATFAADACINDTNNAAGQPTLCGNTDSFVPKGRVLPFSPEWTINAGVQYTFAMGDVEITPRVQWSHVGEQVATPFPSAITLVPGRDLFDARLTFDIGKNYQVEAYVNNIGDKAYIATQIQNSSSATGGIIYGAPRTFGLRLKVQVGK